MASTTRKPSLIRHTGLSYVGQAYALLIGILIMPFYLGHLGAEAYGLIGFFAVMQAWLQLLDAGLSPSLVRQVAHFRGQSDADRFLPGRLLRSFELLVLPVAVLSGLAIHLGSGWIATHWLQAKALEIGTIEQCISLMGVMVAMRLFSTLYKSGLQGMELHPWLNSANMAIATLRYFGGLYLVAEISQEPVDFFVFQAAVAALEALLFMLKAARRLPTPALLTGFNWEMVKPVLPFAGSLTVTTGLWILLTQLDKMLLTNVLLLEEYGYFSLVALISTGLLTLINPLVQTLLPRLTMLTAEKRMAEMHALYLGANRFVASLLFPLAGVIGFHGQELIFAWTGDATAAAWSGPILLWYALGAAIMAIGGFQFYLQYAHGQLRLHLWFSVISTVISVPVLVFAALKHGALGVGIAWFGLRLITYFVWPAVIHRRFAPGVHRPWLRDQLRIAAMTLIGLLLGEPLVQALTGNSRIEILLSLAVGGAICLLLIAITTRPVVVRLSMLMNKPSL